MDQGQHQNAEMLMRHLAESVIQQLERQKFAGRQAEKCLHTATEYAQTECLGFIESHAKTE